LKQQQKKRLQNLNFEAHMFVCFLTGAKSRDGIFTTWQIKLDKTCYLQTK